MLSFSFLCNLEWWCGLGGQRTWLGCPFGKDPPLLVWLELEACSTPAWPCSHCLHHAQDTYGAPHPQGNRSNVLWVCSGKRDLYGYVKRACLVQFVFATSECHRAELPRACGGAAGEGFAWIFLDWWAPVLMNRKNKYKLYIIPASFCCCYEGCYYLFFQLKY